MEYFVWYDESTQKTAAEKIQEASAAYVRRFAIAPNLVLVNSIDQTEVGGMLVHATHTVQPNSFWLARQEVELH